MAYFSKIVQIFSTQTIFNSNANQWSSTKGDHIGMHIIRDTESDISETVEDAESLMVCYLPVQVVYCSRGLFVRSCPES